ncbi:histidine kinase [Lysinibacter sp. HNR]|uniref:sensor histidine kinase n=1 Tax=Lysinibacter sp. HNR TaxID=3031408 RepID=UPI002434FB87|nr:histidine kinase [Lysinibacter sp. HNR]WGD38167.1 histidine kinase [Lysinibacter sp. HNR]
MSLVTNLYTPLLSQEEGRLSRAHKQILITWFMPALGALFLLIWFTNVSYGNPWITAIGLSIAICFISPLGSVLIILGVLTAQILAVVQLPTAETWPAYLGILLIVTRLAFSGKQWIRWLSLAFACVGSILITALLTPWYAWPTWTWDFSVEQGWDGFMGWRYTLTFGISVFAIAGAVWALSVAARLGIRLAINKAQLRESVHELRLAETEIAVASERSRIAHDVHDIMAHSLAVIIAQADGARYAGRHQTHVMQDSLKNIASSARASLTEVRTLIDWLTTDIGEDDAPTLARLDELYRRLSGAGLTLDLQTFGTSVEMSDSRQLAAYRIVQESLTNALKYSDVTVPVRVVLDWQGTGLFISIVSRIHPDGQPKPLSDAPLSQGRGILGMTERAHLAGGWLSAGIDSGPPETFMVTAFIPTSAEDSALTHPSSRNTVDRKQQDDSRTNARSS